MYLTATGSPPLNIKFDTFLHSTALHVKTLELTESILITLA